MKRAQRGGSASGLGVGAWLAVLAIVAVSCGARSWQARDVGASAEAEQDSSSEAESRTDEDRWSVPVSREFVTYLVVVFGWFIVMTLMQNAPDSLPGRLLRTAAAPLRSPGDDLVWSTARVIIPVALLALMLSMPLALLAIASGDIGGEARLRRLSDVYLLNVSAGALVSVLAVLITVDRASVGVTAADLLGRAAAIGSLLGLVPGALGSGLQFVSSAAYLIRTLPRLSRVRRWVTLILMTCLSTWSATLAAILIWALRR